MSTLARRFDILILFIEASSGKVKFWSKIAFKAIRAKLFFQLFSNKT
jgi:hypothetical protein